MVDVASIEQSILQDSLAHSALPVFMPLRTESTAYPLSLGT